MAARYIRDTQILAKIEVTPGTDPTPTGAANAMQASNVRLTPLNAQYVARDLIRNYFGVAEELLASYNKMVSFEVEAVGSGTAGTAPAWGPLIRSCGMAETLVVAERCTYSPITNSQESCTIWVYDSGVKHVMNYCKGAWTLQMGHDGIPKIAYAFVGIDGGDTAATPSGVTFAAFKQPQVLSTQNLNTALTLGATLASSGVPSLTGGTAYPSKGIEIDSGIRAEHIALLGSDSVEIVDRAVKGKFMVDASAAQEIAFLSTIKAGTLQSLGLIHGSVVGRRFGIFGGTVQLRAPSKEEISGKRMVGLEASFTPSDAGNDEIKLITSF